MSIALLLSERCAHLNVLQICLKNPIPTPKIYVFGGFAPKHYCSSSQPPKSTSLAGTASYDLLSVTIGRAVSEEYKKGSPDNDKRGTGPAHALNSIVIIFGMWGGPWTCF